MNRKNFCKIVGISGSLASQWKKNEKAENYQELYEICENQKTIKEQALQILIDKKPKDIEEFFGNPNSAYGFIGTMFASSDSNKVNQRNLKTYIKIIDKFGTKE